MKTYFGIPFTREVRVCEEGAEYAAELPPRHDVANHSPDGFNWGYNGSGPAQLALAILADVYGTQAPELRWYQIFKTKVISLFPRGGGFELSEATVREVVAQIIKENQDEEKSA